MPRWPCLGVSNVFPEIEDPATRAALGTAGFGTAAAIVFRVLMWLRRDKRQDTAEQSTEDVYQGIIAQLEAHIARLETRANAAEAQAMVFDTHNKAQATRLRDEIDARYIAESKLRRTESEMIGLRALIESLRARIVELEAGKHAKP